MHRLIFSKLPLGTMFFDITGQLARMRTIRITTPARKTPNTTLKVEMKKRIVVEKQVRSSLTGANG
jgi:hypothetical protein